MGTKRAPGDFDCYRNAHPDEPMFILLGRDPFAPFLVLLWALLRNLIRGRSRKVEDAFRCVWAMRRWRRSLVKGPLTPPPSPALQCIGCGMVNDGAYSFAEDHPSSIDVGPFCSQCFEGIQELVVRWHYQQQAAEDTPRRRDGVMAPATRPGPPPPPPPNRVIREGDKGPRS